MRLKGQMLLQTTTHLHLCLYGFFVREALTTALEQGPVHCTTNDAACLPLVVSHVFPVLVTPRQCNPNPSEP
ncbi:hypothetical protein GGR55DRAFT_668349 [Xylaria sp. FL0064]|nr:hypothetical protein GGR55DRAFT_668349 [Xylaria sp. FL0064]